MKTEKPPSWSDPSADAAVHLMVDATAKLGTDRAGELMTEILSTLPTHSLLGVAISSTMRLIIATSRIKQLEETRVWLAKVSAEIEMYCGEDEVPEHVAKRLLGILGLA
jgi:hypothetical protein